VVHFNLLFWIHNWAIVGHQVPHYIHSQARFSSPANYLLQKLPIGKSVAANLLIWGMLVMFMAATKNFAGAASIRFLMELFEAFIQPSWTHVTGIRYTGHEQSPRMTGWYSFVRIAQIVGGLLSYGVGNIHTGVAH
jgi:MFS transporter, ACS family, allantoate permease